MRVSASNKSAVLAAVMTSLLLGSATVSASPPSDVADLVGARGSGGEMELGRRGYSYVTMSHGVQYWWNADRGSCVGVKVAEGRYKTVSTATPSQCHQKAPHSSSSHQATSAAESACMEAVNASYGGKVDTVRVVRSEFSQANSEVMVDAVGVRGGSQTEHWRCLSSNDGKVQDLSVAQ